VKGGESDTVYLFPDLLKSGASQLAGARTNRLDVKRQFYVGMTRARESLIICGPRTWRDADLPRVREYATR